MTNESKPERPLHDYIDMEAYDVVSGEKYRELVEQHEAVTRDRDAALGQLDELDEKVRELLEQLEAYAKFDDVIAALSDARRDDYRKLQRLKAASSPASSPPYTAAEQATIDRANEYAEQNPASELKKNA